MSSNQNDMFPERIWKVSVETKYGTDVVLIRQEEEPNGDELRSIEEQFSRDYDVEATASTEAGSIMIDSIPIGVAAYLASE